MQFVFEKKPRTFTAIFLILSFGLENGHAFFFNYTSPSFKEKVNHSEDLFQTFPDSLHLWLELIHGSRAEAAQQMQK